MHFNIIQISPNRVSKEDRIDEFSICEDPLVDMETKYAGDKKKYSNVIGTIKEELRPFATVNVRRRTIREFSYPR